MTDQYPHDAWGIEMLAHNNWYLLEGHVYGRLAHADRGLRNLIDEGLHSKELRIVPLTITKRDTP